MGQIKGKTAFVFPGQGAAHKGIGKALYCAATNIAQPAIFMADLKIALALKDRGIDVDGAAGFSLGEVPALAFCGLLGTREALDFVCVRADAMHECTQKHKGGMMAVLGLSDDDVEEICSQIEGAYPANYNSPGQLVVSYSEGTDSEGTDSEGTDSEGTDNRPVDALKAAVATAKGKCMPLPVAGAFHSPLMDNAADVAKAYLEKTTFGEMSIPLYANATAQLYEDPKSLLARQINSPVLWRATIENMIADGYDTFIETGPGTTLTGIIKKINKTVRTFNVYDEATLESVVNQL